MALDVKSNTQVDLHPGGIALESFTRPFCYFLNNN